MPADSVLHDLTMGTFLVMFAGALLVFTPAPNGARRDIRAALMSGSIWAVILSTYRAHRAPAPLVIAAIALLGIGLALFVWSAYSIHGKVFSYAYTHDTPQFLHTSGPYAYVRNPFYVSYLTVGAACILMWPTWLGAAFGLAMLVVFDRLARFEERKFESSPVRAEYERYKARTGRLLPRFSAPR
jgi:protein-S-isoprenylcysteine O-methyltransferase Ste14